MFSQIHHWMHSHPLFRSCLVLACLMASGQIHALNIENIRISKTGDATRIVLDASTTPDYKLFALNNPPRIVIDIKKAALNTAINQAIFKDSAVLYLRHAKRNNEDLRIVLDLDYQTVSTSFVLAPSDQHPHRLVIDLRSKATTKPSTIKKAIVASIKPVTKASVKPTPAKVITSSKKSPFKPRTLIITVDAGHGGKDPGAIGVAGTHEKKVVLEISKRLVKLINAEPGMRAIMTRNSDHYVSLRGRLQKARKPRADLFISVHADAVENRKARGSSVYILSKNGASSEAARILAKSQNRTDTISGVSLAGKDKVLQKVIVDLSQSATIDSSLDLAIAVRNELVKLGKTRDRIDSAGFAVLKSPDIPSILVETAFISNPTEEKKLRSPSHQQKLATSILKGIKKYLVHNAPEDTRFASNTIIDQHTVRNGETLSAIALRYKVSLDLLRAVNRLKTDSIRVGEQLVIPTS